MLLYGKVRVYKSSAAVLAVILVLCYDLVAGAEVSECSDKLQCVLTEVNNLCCTDDLITDKLYFISKQR